MPRIKERHTPIRFKDCNEYKGCNGTYYATNEEPKLFAEFLKDIEVDRAAAICSGGEIGLLVLLPKVKRELVLIDHHYETMSFAMMKWLLIQTVGGKEAYRLLTTSNGELFEHIKKLCKRLPSPLREKYNEAFTASKKNKMSGLDYGAYERYNAITGFCRRETGPNSAVKREWDRFKAEDVEAIEGSLHKVQFLHGDLVEDLKKRKPFDLLYISNAMQYIGRSRQRMTAEQIFKLVKPGGFILSTDSLHDYATLYGGGEKVVPKPRVEIYEKLTKGSRTSWGHFLTRVPEASAVPA